MEFLFEYLGFLAKTATVVIAALVVISALAAASAHRALRTPPGGHIEVVALNERLQDMHRAVEEAALPATVIKRRRRQDAKRRKRHRKEEARRERRLAKMAASRERASAAAEQSAAGEDAAGGKDAAKGEDAAAASEQTGGDGEPSGEGEARGQVVPAEAEPKPADVRRRVFVLSFNGDLAASAVDNLRLEISAVLGAANEGDEVVVRVESAGGTVHGYGLGASQLARVRGRGVALTVAVDKVAASGGYLMAAVADRILAAPFAIVGSIGVVAQVPNVHRLLKKHDVDVEVLTAGRFKRTLDFLGENTEEGREKLRQELEDVHALFQEYVGSWRPKVDMETVSTGEAWHGQRALDHALVDELVTSDEYLARACENSDVFEVSWVQPKRPIERLLGQAAEAAGAGAARGLRVLIDQTANWLGQRRQADQTGQMGQLRGDIR